MMNGTLITVNIRCLEPDDICADKIAQLNLNVMLNMKYHETDHISTVSVFGHIYQPKQQICQSSCSRSPGSKVSKF